MRFRLLAVLALLGTMSVSATEVSDGTGDVIGTLQTGQQVPAPEGARDHIDITGVTLTETEKDIIVELRTREGTPSDGYSMRHIVYFAHGTMEHGLEVTQSFPEGTPLPSSAYASLRSRPIGSASWSSGGPATLLDPPGDGLGFRASVEKMELTDAEGTPPLPGRVLHSVWAETVSWRSNVYSVSAVPGPGQVIEWRDRMPDEGVSDAELAIQYGASDDGTIRLSSPRPGRVSNGEETTYVFDVYAVNLQDHERTFTFDVSGVPEQWDVSLPVSATRLEAGASQYVPVVVAVPFAHQHGAVLNLTVVADDLDSGRSEAFLQLTVRYLEIPQPAGHHDTLFVHTAYQAPGDETGEGVSSRPYMNTLADDEKDTRQ